MITILFLISSCQKEEVGNTPLLFEGEVSTKASVSTTATISTMGVFAYYTGTSDFDAATATPNFMYDQFVTRSGSIWSYSPEKYWPMASEKVSFVAYSPHATAENGITVSSANDAVGLPTLDFTTKTLSTSHVDLLASSLVPNRNQTQGSVGFSFDHILTKIGFAAKLSATSDESISITDIKIIDVMSQGTYSMASGHWSTPTTPITLSAYDGEIVLFTSVKRMGEDLYSFVIPQEVDAMIVEVTYKINFTTIKKRIPLLPTADWTKGSSFLYTIILDPSDTQAILTLSITPWITPTIPGITLE